jgi:SpoVK/Ycf46/Vps4 family AAA+-type ATPase
MDAARDAFLDGACGPVLVVCATNVPHLLDPDLLCPTRVGVRVHVPPPEPDAIRALAGAVLRDWGWPAVATNRQTDGGSARNQEAEATDEKNTIGGWIRDEALLQWASADGAAATGADLRNALNVLALQTAALAAESGEELPTGQSPPATDGADDAGELAPAARVLRLLCAPKSDAAAAAMVTATLGRVRPSVRREDLAPLIAFASS